MKKSKTESERDLLAKNHKRLNKAISDLLTENKALRKRVEASIVEINDLRNLLRLKGHEDWKRLVNSTVHSLAGRLDLTSIQVAERSVTIADEVMRRITANDNGVV